MSMGPISNNPLSNFHLPEEQSIKTKPESPPIQPEEILNDEQPGSYVNNALSESEGYNKQIELDLKTRKEVTDQSQKLPLSPSLALVEHAEGGDVPPNDDIDDEMEALKQLELEEAQDAEIKMKAENKLNASSKINEIVDAKEKIADTTIEENLSIQSAETSVKSEETGVKTEKAAIKSEVDTIKSQRTISAAKTDSATTLATREALPIEKLSSEAANRIALFKYAEGQHNAERPAFVPLGINDLPEHAQVGFDPVTNKSYAIPNSHLAGRIRQNKNIPIAIQDAQGNVIHAGNVAGILHADDVATCFHNFIQTQVSLKKLESVESDEEKKHALEAERILDNLIHQLESKEKKLDPKDPEYKEIQYIKKMIAQLSYGKQIARILHKQKLERIEKLINDRLEKSERLKREDIKEMINADWLSIKTQISNIIKGMDKQYRLLNDNKNAFHETMSQSISSTNSLGTVVESTQVQVSRTDGILLKVVKRTNLAFRGFSSTLNGNKLNGDSKVLHTRSFSPRSTILDHHKIAA